MFLENSHPERSGEKYIYISRNNFFKKGKIKIMYVKFERQTLKLLKVFQGESQEYEYGSFTKISERPDSQSMQPQKGHFR